MATTSPSLTIPFTVGTSKIVGQGNQPEAWVLYSTDDASESTPNWTDATTKVRTFSTSRGRESELQEVDAGTTTLTLDNRERDFDPVINTSIRPMNRWWIREQFSSETQDIFKGYAESYDQQWPGGMDAEAVVSCVDEFKVLALDRLPVMDPLVDSYEALVQFDKPAGYWRWSDTTLSGVAGPTWISDTPTGSGYSILNTTPIVGDSTEFGGALSLTPSGRLINTPEAFDTQGAGLMATDFWYRFSALPGSAASFFLGASLGTPTPTRTFWFELSTGGAVSFKAHNVPGTLHTVTSSALSTNTWYHVAGVIDGSAIRLYINGAQAATTSWTGVLHDGTNPDPANPPTIQGSTSVTHDIDELAFYSGKTLSAGRVLAHYTAGTVRGFPIQVTGVRAGAVLDTVSSQAPRRLDPGLRDVVPRFMFGQDPLSELRLVDRADDPDSLFFVGKDGALVFLDGDHRSSAPYNTVQATFDDDGTDLPYLSLVIDYSEAFLANDFSGSRINGGLLTASDATSIDKYFHRSQLVSDLPVTDDADAQDILDALLAKYKDPLTRILNLTLTTHDPAVTEAVFRRDIGDRIRVFRTPPGGGARIDQTLFVQKIAVEGANDQAPWRITLGVSPL